MGQFIFTVKVGDFEFPISNKKIASSISKEMNVGF
jgi:hypothetical protein